jgi:hypothetical protein
VLEDAEPGCFKELVVSVVRTLAFRFHEDRVIWGLATHPCVEGEKFLRHGVRHLIAFLEEEHDLRMESTNLLMGVTVDEVCNKSIDLMSQGARAAIHDTARALAELTDVNQIKHMGGVNEKEEDLVTGNRLLRRDLLANWDFVAPKVSHGI